MNKPVDFGAMQGDCVPYQKPQPWGMTPDMIQHEGQVHAYVIRGQWLYLEHDWVARAGSYVFEPPGETHTLVVPDDCTDMVTLFTVHGALMYVDPQGNSTGYDDVFTRIEKYRAHFEAVGLGADYVREFLR